MDESQLKSLIDCLNKQIDALHGRDHFWTTLLIIGCAFEVVTVCREYLEDRTDWRKARSRRFLFFAEKPPIKWLVFDMLGVILVLAGIGGELHVSKVAGALETQLRDANAKLVLRLEKKAGVAVTSAQDAINKAGAAKTVADSAAKKASAASASAEAANEQAGEVADKLTAANAEIAELDSRRTELEKTLLPRTFSLAFPRDFDKLNRLKDLTGTKISLRFLPDAEAERATGNLAGLFNEVGWTISETIPDSSKYTSFFDGVTIGFWGAPPEQVENAGRGGKNRMQELTEFTQLSAASSRRANELVDFLKAQGWEAQARWADVQLPSDTLEVTVGFKPSPYFDPDWLKKMHSRLETQRQRDLDFQRRLDEREKNLRK
jgi:hypothetical protein